MSGDQQVEHAAAVLAGQQYATVSMTEFQPDVVSAVEFALGRTLNERARDLALKTYERERLRLVEANRV